MREPTAVSAKNGKRATRLSSILDLRREVRLGRFLATKPAVPTVCVAPETSPATVRACNFVDCIEAGREGSGFFSAPAVVFNTAFTTASSPPPTSSLGVGGRASRGELGAGGEAGNGLSSCFRKNREAADVNGDATALRCDDLRFFCRPRSMPASKPASWPRVAFAAFSS